MKMVIGRLSDSILKHYLKNLTFKLVLMGIFQFVLGIQQAFATTYYVSPAGYDSNAGTSSSAPLKTIDNALRRATRSGDVVYVMTGTYSETVTVDHSGITLSALPNNFPVIDGGNNLPSSDWGSLLSVSGNDNIVSGFEVKNSNVNGARAGGFGVWIGGVRNKVSNMNVHHTWENGILIQGDYNTVEGSTISNAAWQNSREPRTGWSSGLSAARNPSASALKRGITSYPTFRRNKVYNNWGEGLSCYESDHCTIEDNIVYDNYAVNLYLSDASNSVVQRNIVYISSAPAIASKNSPGLTLADEVSSVPRSANNVIINNFIYNTHLQAFSWTLVPNSGLNNVLIANNTIVNGTLDTGVGGGSSIVNRDSQIRNNIIIGDGSSVPSNSGITFSNNNWSVRPSQAASSTDIIGNPQVARTGSTTPGALTAAYFKLLASSPVINKAMPINSVAVDFFLQTRGSSPDIGGHEFNSTTPTATPANALVPRPEPPSQNPLDTNLALNRPVKASSTQATDARGSYNASFAVDGNSTTRWSSTISDSQFFTIDLGSRKQIKRVVLNWETAYGKNYELQVSDDNANWTKIYSTSTSDGGIDDLSGLSGVGRFIRMKGVTRGTEWGYSLYEVSVYGTAASLSLNRPTKVSSTQTTDARGSYNASFAVDGNSSTRWSSAPSDAQSFAVDLGSRKQINRVVLNWETAYGKSYQIQVSDDDVTWTTIFSTTAGNGGIDDLSGLSGSGRYIRMNGTSRGTEWGYSLYEMSVYGN